MTTEGRGQDGLHGTYEDLMTALAELDGVAEHVHELLVKVGAPRGLTYDAETVAELVHRATGWCRWRMETDGGTTR